MPYIVRVMAETKPRVNPADVYPPEVIQGVKSKVRWFNERGHSKKARPLLDKFYAGEPIYPCEWVMGPIKTRNPHLTVKELTPPAIAENNQRKWARFASRISDLDPEVLRESSVEDIVSLLIASGVYDPNWESNPPEDTTFHGPLEPEEAPKAQPTSADQSLFEDS